VFGKVLSAGESIRAEARQSRDICTSSTATPSVITLKGRTNLPIARFTGMRWERYIRGGIFGERYLGV